MVFANDQHAEVHTSWGVYTRIVAAYRHPDLTVGKPELPRVIAALSSGLLKPLTELTTLGRTPNRRAVDVLAYFDRTGISNAPTEAIDGRLEHLRVFCDDPRNPW